MKLSFKKLPGSKIALEVALDPAEFKAYYDAAEAEALAQVELKGFRKGTAPRELAERAVDKDKVFHAATEDAVRRTLNDEGETNKWSLIDTPRIEVTEASPTGKVGLKYKAEFTVFPEVKLGDYKKIAKKILSEKQEVVVPLEEMERSLTWLRESRAKTVAVRRPAANGDLLDIDFEGLENGIAVPGVKAKGDRFVLGASKFIPGFDEALAGKQAGETATFPLLVPETHWNKAIRGKTIQFKVRVNGVYERTVPELTDEFAKGLGAKFQTAEDVRNNIAEGLRAEKAEEQETKRKEETLERIGKESAIDIPSVMVERALARMAAEARKSIPPGSTSDEELSVALRPRAEAGVRRQLVLYAIAEAEKLQPTPEEVNAESALRSLDPVKFYDYNYGVVQERKVFEQLTLYANE